jgi:tetratricopeptide (TPR) repeat protein
MKTLFIFLFFTLPTFAVAQTDSSVLYLQKGNDANNERRYMVAYWHFKKSLEFNGDNTDARKALGKVCMEMRKYDEALAAFTEVVKKQPGDTIAVKGLAGLNFWTRRWNSAIAYAKKMKTLGIGENADYYIGKSYYELEDYGQSYTYLQAAAKEDPANAEIPYTIGRSFVEMSNYRAAASFFENAVRLDSSKPRWIYECALNFAAIPSDKEAIKYYLLAAERGYKTDNDYYDNLATSYLGLGQLDKCLELLKKVLEKKPADLELLYSIGDISYKAGKYQEAIDYWDKILYYDKQNARSLYMIGLAYQKKGDKEKGMQLCDQAIKMDPSLQNLKQKKMNIGM